MKITLPHFKKSMHSHRHTRSAWLVLLLSMTILFALTVLGHFALFVAIGNDTFIKNETVVSGKAPELLHRDALDKVLAFFTLREEATKHILESATVITDPGR